nr:iron-sulfur cluster-binding domain-containing protein [Arsukibacterium sp.]
MLLLTVKVSERWTGFVPGQHIVLTIKNNGRYLSRPFSICSSLKLWQSQQQIQLCCKVNAMGEVTPLLAQLANASMLNISLAQGDFHWQQPDLPAMFIAAGSGITPVAAMLLSQRHWLAPVTLHYRCRGAENAALLTALQQLATRQPLFQLQLSDSRVEPAAAWQQQLIADISHQQFYLCGPAAFMQQQRNALVNAGINSTAIRQEQFGVAMSGPADPEADASTLSGHFIRAGTRIAVSLNRQQSLLQNAEQYGLTPRFGCRVGVCFQCVCDKVSGQVRDIRSGDLSGHGAEQIQLCVSQPVTELVIKL